MGKLKGKYVSGAVGPYILKVVKGETHVTSRPVKGTRKLSQASKLSAETFGMAASLAKSIRAALVYQTNDFVDIDMPGRMVSLVSKTVFNCRDKNTGLYNFEQESFNELEGMEFNIKSLTNKSLLKRPKAIVNDGVMKVNIKRSILDKDLKFPAHTFYCKIMVSLSLFRLGDGQAIIKSETQEIMIGRNQLDMPEQEISFTLPDGCLCIATVFMQFFHHGAEGGLSFNNKNFNPGSVIKAIITPGIYAKDDNRTWIDMTVFPED